MHLEFKHRCKQEKKMVKIETETLPKLSFPTRFHEEDAKNLATEKMVKVETETPA